VETCTIKIAGAKPKSQMSRKKPNQINSMKKVKLFSLMFLVAGMLVLNGCQKEGPAGEDGRDGNANVVSTTVTSSAWIYSDPSWTLNIPYAAVTQDIINTGAVLVYAKVETSFNQLPLTFYQTPTYSTSVEVSSYAGGVNLIWTDSDLIQPNTPNLETFKIVVISSAGIAQNPNVDLSNYEEVASAFLIAE